MNNNHTRQTHFIFNLIDITFAYLDVLLKHIFTLLKVINKSYIE